MKEIANTIQISNELNVNGNGIISCSRRGLALLSGVALSTLQNLIKTVRKGDRTRLSKSLEPFAQQDFEGDRPLPDVFCAAVIQHYAFKGKEVAQESLMAFSSIGFRQWGQKIVGWQSQQENEELKALAAQSTVLDKQLELRKLDHTMLTMHGAPIVLALRGKEDQVVEVEKKTVEVIDERHNQSVRFKGQTLKQIADHLKETNGVTFKSGKALKEFLAKQNAEHLVAQTPRSVLQDYVPDENLEEVYRIAKTSKQQLLLGEN